MVSFPFLWRREKKGNLWFKLFLSYREEREEVICGFFSFPIEKREER